MKLADLKFDKIFCVNLAHRGDRKKAAMAEFRKLGVDPVFYDAINAKEMGIVHKGDLKPGMIGCYLSHYFLLQHCLMSGYNRVLIFEDDLKVIDGGLSLLGHALPILPEDWQFAYLGHTIYDDQRQYTKPVNQFWNIPGGSWGTQAYMLNGRDAIETLYRSLKKINIEIDLHMSYKALPQSGLRYYSITPSCIKQAKRKSDVQ